MIIRLKTGDERAAVRTDRGGSKQTLYKSALWARAGCAGSIGMALTRESAFLSVDALPEPLEANRVRKVPTGIADLDSIVDGGLPSGSTILLCGDVGAGMQEYIYTAASKTALVHERPEARHYYLGDRCDDSDVPDRVCYVTFSRSKEIILQELATSFNGDYYRAFRDHTVFKDFSSTYFRHSVVPASWTEQEDVFDLPATNILEELVTFLDENAHDSMVVIDSLTDLAISDLVEVKDLVTTIQGMPRADGRNGRRDPGRLRPHRDRWARRDARSRRARWAYHHGPRFVRDRQDHLRAAIPDAGPDQRRESGLHLPRGGRRFRDRERRVVRVGSEAVSEGEETPHREARDRRRDDDRHAAPLRHPGLHQNERRA